ncbi:MULTISPECIES: YkvA family protein [unclassified Fusibacter]|uniref:YkvA family protein n=1 Tax=unclassified Fusibacter TaxID=2624464 RepID=UPI001012940F|nr:MULTISPECIES: YkvA family protein [unclassified Fusibacter]MCK8058368.1 YkvA family protein [Fusibacter sp. A2]NPE20951.1 DUF1232 domain-containing protein [Fusibacter sp. A1]RXV63153.1 DUF1232 domain-containing protein [Fusibacter sp. A1]
MQSLNSIKRLKQWAARLKTEIIALYLVLKHPQTPLYAKLFVALVVGYALSPIDLIPDFIPVIGYLDDLILLPMGIAIAIRLVPPDLMQACRKEAIEHPLAVRPKNWIAALVIVTLWLALILVVISNFVA